MNDNGKIKVFIADDSAVARQSIIHILEKEKKHIEIIGTAPNGKVALEKLNLTKYESDVIIVDMVMPEMDGVEFIKQILSKSPIPIIAVSAFKSKKDIEKALARLGSEVFESGAVEFIRKPDSRTKGDYERFDRQLIKTVKSHVKIDLIKSFTNYKPQAYVFDQELIKEETRELLIRHVDNSNRIIIIGASTGGPKAISFLLSQLKSSSPPIVIIQHMPKEMMMLWCTRLQNSNPKLKISLVKDKEKIRPNHIYIVPGGLHCAIDEGKIFQLFEGKKINFVAPAVDVTFSSAAKIYGKNVLGIVLTGMGNDGSKGAKEIKRNGGIVFVEHDSTCVMNSMPYSVIKSKAADRVVPLHKIPAMLRINGWV